MKNSAMNELTEDNFRNHEKFFYFLESTESCPYRKSSPSLYEAFVNWLAAFNSVEHTFNYDHLKEAVEGIDSETVITFDSPTTADDIYEAFMGIDTNKVITTTDDFNFFKEQIEAALLSGIVSISADDIATDESFQKVDDEQTT